MYNVSRPSSSLSTVHNYYTENWGGSMQGQVETEESENWNGKLKRKTEAESGNGKAEIRK
jgi:hypothetical protein